VTFDHLLFKFISSLAGKWIILDALAIFCAEYLIFGLILFLIYFLIFKKINFRQFFITFISITLALLINKLISLFCFRARPFITHPEIYQLVEHSVDKSFPSDHTAIAFVLAVSAWFFNKKWGKWFLIMAILIGLARIFCGLHYPIDVLVGGIVGAGVVVVVNCISQKVTK
jgi:undecaprenyl-diphosphatase